MTNREKIKDFIETFLYKIKYDHLCTFDVVFGLPNESPNPSNCEFIVVLYFDSNINTYIKKCQKEISETIFNYLGVEVDIISKIIPELCANEG
jgi:hypothetical protein